MGLPWELELPDGEKRDFDCYAVRSATHALPESVLKWAVGLAGERRRDLLCSPSGYYIVVSENRSALAGGRRLGFVCFDLTVTADGRYAVQCLELQVIPDARRKGLGRLLAGQLERICAQLRYDLVLVRVPRDSTAMVALFKSLGYAESGEGKWVTLTRSLSSPA